MGMTPSQKQVQEENIFVWRRGVGCAGSRQSFDMGIVAQWSFASDPGLLFAFSQKPMAPKKSGLIGFLLCERRFRNDRTTAKVLMQP